MRSLLITFFALWAWSAVAFVAVATFVAAITATLLTGLFDRRRAITGTVVRIGSRACATLNPLWDFGVHGPVPDSLPERLICVSNHCSQTDIFLIAHLPWHMRWLSKSVLFLVPFVGWSMWLAGDVGIKRGTSRSAKAAMKACAERIKSGIPLMIFPEGTRSPTDELLPFKDGAFRLAIETQATILPVAVEGTRTALRKHDWRPNPAVGRVMVGRPISTEGLRLSDVQGLKRRARDRIVELRALMRAELQSAKSSLGADQSGSP